jgi:transposase
MNTASLRSPVVRRAIEAINQENFDEFMKLHFDRALYRERNMVERCINRLKQYQRVATPYETPAATYVALGTIAAILR